MIHWWSCQVDQVGLVEHDDGANAADFRRDQVSVDQVELEARLIECRDDEHLVDIRRDDMLAMAVPARDHAAPVFDFFDETVGSGG